MLNVLHLSYSCVISSFITKPQLMMYCIIAIGRCVISSFITKPQREGHRGSSLQVALYPLSSPNHNHPRQGEPAHLLRYILFHHQTTTVRKYIKPLYSCVISSFITKPQLLMSAEVEVRVALYPLSSPNHNLQTRQNLLLQVALYPLSSPNHNRLRFAVVLLHVALYPLSSPNHNLYFLCIVI